jgi:hypothetical protein
LGRMCISFLERRGVVVKWPRGRKDVGFGWYIFILSIGLLVLRVYSVVGSCTSQGGVSVGLCSLFFQCFIFFLLYTPATCLGSLLLPEYIYLP